MKKLLIAVTVIFASCGTETPDPVQVIQKSMDSTLFQHKRHYDSAEKYKELIDVERKFAELDYEKSKFEWEKQSTKGKGDQMLVWGSSLREYHDYHTPYKRHSDTLSLLDWKYRYLQNLQQLLTTSKQ